MTEKIRGIWDGDLLGRKEDANNLRELITSRVRERESADKKGSYVVNLDAKWGQGKSFFLERMYQDVLTIGHPAVFIDAWKYDYIDDPYTNVIASIEAYFTAMIKGKSVKAKARAKAAEYLNAATSNAGSILVTGIKGGLKRLGERAIGEAFNEIGEMISDKIGNDEIKKEVENILTDLEKETGEFAKNLINSYAQKRIDDFRKTKLSLDDFVKNFEGLLRSIDKPKPMFVFIDELDRCKPTYAIAMLERIKHLFDITGVVFVLATDTEQLSQSVKAVYGSGFDSQQYLGRFFNRSFRLREVKLQVSAEQLIVDNNVDITKWSVPGKAPEIEEFAIFIGLTAKFFNLSLRQLNQSFEILQDVTSVWVNKFPIELAYMYPMICTFVTKKKIDPLEDDIFNGDATRFVSIKSKTDVHWVAELQNGTVNYAEMFTLFYELSKMNIKRALVHLEGYKGRERSLIYGHISQAISEEAEYRTSTNARAKLSYSQYPALIENVSQVYY